MRRPVAYTGQIEQNAGMPPVMLAPLMHFAGIALGALLAALLRCLRRATSVPGSIDRVFPNSSWRSNP
jgi:hypothetical protein